MISVNLGLRALTNAAFAGIIAAKAMKERVARLQGPSESRERCKPAAGRRANMAPEPRARTAVASAGASRYRRGRLGRPKGMVFM